MAEQCRACPALIAWGVQNPTERNPNPKPNPLDLKPDPKGNLRLNTASMTYDVLTGDNLKQAHDRGEELYLSHFVTCPNRNKFRKPKGKK